jgi:hypothetical protein
VLFVADREIESAGIESKDRLKRKEKEKTTEETIIEQIKNLIQTQTPI